MHIQLRKDVQKISNEDEIKIEIPLLEERNHQKTLQGRGRFGCILNVTTGWRIEEVRWTGVAGSAAEGLGIDLSQWKCVCVLFVC